MSYFTKMNAEWLNINFEQKYSSLNIFNAYDAAAGEKFEWVSFPSLSFSINSVKFIKILKINIRRTIN